MNNVLVKTKATLKSMYRCRVLYLMIALPIISVFIFHYMPIYGVQIAFKDYKTKLGIWGSEWVGLKHFINFFKHPYFIKILKNTILINLVSLVSFPLPIIFAIMLNEMKHIKLKRICQTLTYAPYFVSVVVVCTMINIFSSTGGLFNVIADNLGIGYSNFLGNPKAFAPIIAISEAWSGLGWGTIIYMATLSGVSQELVEAAQIDGASRMQIIWHVHLPHIKPTIITLFILKIGSMLSLGFEKVYLLQNPLNMDASSVIATYQYELGVLGGQMSYSSAIGLFNNIVNVILVMLANAISKKLSGVGMW